MKFLQLAVLACTILLLSLSCNEFDTRATAIVEPLKDEEQQFPPDGSKDNYSITSDTIATPQLPQHQQHDQIQKTNQSGQDWDKKIIRNASLQLEVANYKKFNQQLRLDVTRLGGYIEQEEQTESDYKIENIMSIKIPVYQFDNMVAILTPDQEKLIEKKITSEDVSGQVVDTRSRMEAKRQARLRYLELLKQAKNIEEVLLVQKEINEIQQQIEAAAGRISYLTHASAYSTIQFTFYQILNAHAETIHQPSFLKQIGTAFNEGLSWMRDLVLGLVMLWPLWIVILTLIWLYKKWKLPGAKSS